MNSCDLYKTIREIRWHLLSFYIWSDSMDKNGNIDIYNHHVPSRPFTKREYKLVTKAIIENTKKLTEKISINLREHSIVYFKFKSLQLVTAYNLDNAKMKNVNKCNERVQHLHQFVIESLSCLLSAINNIIDLLEIESNQNGEFYLDNVIEFDYDIFPPCPFEDDIVFKFNTFKEKIMWNLKICEEPMSTSVIDRNECKMSILCSKARLFLDSIYKQHDRPQLQCESFIARNIMEETITYSIEELKYVNDYYHYGDVKGATLSYNMYHYKILSLITEFEIISDDYGMQYKGHEIGDKLHQCLHDAKCEIENELKTLEKDYEYDLICDDYEIVNMKYAA